jgi:glycerol-3-phosphate dehydrogenase (NAD(P)+)
MFGSALMLVAILALFFQTGAESFGFLHFLGEGGTLGTIRNMGLGLAEGVFTAPVALALAQQHRIDAPLVGAVNLLISGKAKIDTLVPMLMRRPLKRED